MFILTKYTCDFYFFLSPPLQNNQDLFFSDRMRKCHNPRLSIKSAISQEGTAKVPVQMAATNTSTAVFKEVRKVPPTIIKVQEEKILPAETSGDQVLKAFQQEKAVFVPRQMTRSQPDQKVIIGLFQYFTQSMGR